MTETSSSARSPLAVVILAAGLGTRMKSDTPKVLHEVCGRPMLSYVIDAALSVSPERIVVVTGPEQGAVAEVLTAGCERAVQRERRGTGDAVRAGLEPLEGFEGDVVVLVGDAPLVDGEFLQGLVAAHRAAASRATVATAVLAEPAHYGRVVRDRSGDVLRVVEARDATADELRLTEVNTGFYLFDVRLLREVLPRLEPANVQGELYLTDVVHLALSDGVPVKAYVAPDPEVMLAINSRVELAEVNALMRRRLLERLMLAGVTIEDPSTVYVDWGVEVGRDTVLRANTHLLGRTTIGAASEIGPGSHLRDAFVGDRARVVASHLYECVVGSRCSVGPFAYIRPNTVLAEGAKAGTFVEIKNSRVGEASKVPHLSYVGDATIGRGSNVGAGNITANYDGEHKHPTHIGDGVRTGSDTTFVAPVTVGDGAYTGAGSVITHDVPPGALAVARGRQQTIEGYTERRAARRLREQAEAEAARAEAVQTDDEAGRENAGPGRGDAPGSADRADGVRPAGQAPEPAPEQTSDPGPEPAPEQTSDPDPDAREDEGPPERGGAGPSATPPPRSRP
jgi:bifunctional UDP-N-acetylglucosamine pyrophosphorylase/glucosamine-1-phosphate N-acetyltransferase